MAEEIDPCIAPAVQRNPVAGDGQPFAAIQTLAQLQHDRRVQFADLDEP